MATVYLAEDNEIQAELISEVLSLGNTVRAFSSAPPLIEAARSAPPDAIILDIMMPALSGLEALNILNSDPELAHIPVMMVTALSSTDKVVDALGRGASDYIQKPFDPRDLRSRVQAMVRLKFQKDQYRTLLRERDDLVANLLRDIKSPLAAAHAYAELLAESPAQNTSQPLYLRELSLTLEELGRVTNVAEMALSSSKPTISKLGKVEARDLFSATRRAVATHTRLLNVNFITDCPAGDNIAFNADRGLLSHALISCVFMMMRNLSERSTLKMRGQQGNGYGTIALFASPEKEGAGRTNADNDSINDASVALKDFDTVHRQDALPAGARLIITSFGGHISCNRNDKGLTIEISIPLFVK